MIRREEQSIDGFSPCIDLDHVAAYISICALHVVHEVYSL